MSQREEDVRAFIRRRREELQNEEVQKRARFQLKTGTPVGKGPGISHTKSRISTAPTTKYAVLPSNPLVTTIGESTMPRKFSGDRTAASGFNVNRRAFLDAIAWAEGTFDEVGYNKMFGGKTFEDFETHPNEIVSASMGGRRIRSSAAGRYQFLNRTWRGLNLPDFSPLSQDIGALMLINRRGALRDIDEGNWDSAIQKLGREWASFPGSPYGQPTKKKEELLKFIQDRIDLYSKEEENEE